MFKFNLGLEAESNVTKLRGILTARSENLNMCNRYYIQPRADKNMKIPDGWWVDENEIIIIQKKIENIPTTSGGPMSKIR